MKKKKIFSSVLFLLLFLVNTANVFSKNKFEINLQGDLGTRFHDSFDTAWENYIYSKDEINSNYQVSQLTYLRNLFNGKISFLFSPTNNHFIGLSLSFIHNIEQPKNSYTISSSGISSNISLEYFSYSPGIIYKYYPKFTKFKKLYFLADIGYTQGQMSLEKDNNKYNFNQLTGGHLELKSGFDFNLFWKIKGFFEFGFSISVLTDFETNYEDKSIYLKTNDSQMALVSKDEEKYFDDFSSTNLWMNQVMIGFGVSLKL